jgi:hypothetical protein
VPAVEGIIAVVPFHEAVLVGDVVGVEVKMAPVSGRPIPFRTGLCQPPDAPRALVPVLKLRLSPSRGGDRQAAEDYQ